LDYSNVSGIKSAVWLSLPSFSIRIENQLFAKLEFRLMPSLSRRQVITGSSAILAATVGLAADAPPPTVRLKVLVTGGHPDDPESGCGGAIARYVDSGHEVTILYLTRGEAGIKRKTHDEAAAIRTAEAIAACKILGARPLFAGQIDGATEIAPARYAEYRKLVVAESPDVIFTQWPIDTHADHRACSLLTFDAWMAGGRKAALYYYEVDLGGQTQLFHPTDYVDVTAVESRLHDACFAHASQNPGGGFWTTYHEPMLRFRGMESGYKLAEAFVHHEQSPGGRLPEAG
jgi:LmbE family N-acetylglucosaminyl deacetylase